MLLFLFLVADIFVRATLVQLIPEIYARCIELGHPELDFYLFDRMLEISLRFLKNEENMVSSCSSMAMNCPGGIYIRRLSTATSIHVINFSLFRSRSFSLSFALSENQVRESAISTVKTLLLKNYLGLPRIEEMVCPTTVDLLQLDGLPEDVLKERNPDAFAVRIHFIFFSISPHLIMQHES